MSIVGITGISIFFGLRKGFFFSLFSFLAIVLGFMLAGYFTGLLSPFLGAGKAGKWAVFAVFLVLSISGLYMVGRFVLLITQIFLSGTADKLLGVLVGLLRGVIICGILLFFTLLLDAANFEPVKESKIAPRLMHSMKTLVKKSPLKTAGQLVKIFPGL